MGRMGRKAVAVTIAASLIGAGAPPAPALNAAPVAASAPTKAKPKARGSADGTITVRVTNWRNADLVELEAAESGSAHWTKVLAGLKAGQWAPAELPRGADCRVDLRGTFADGQSADESNVDVCADRTVNLTN